MKKRIVKNFTSNQKSSFNEQMKMRDDDEDDSLSEDEEERDSVQILVQYQKHGG